MKIAVNSRSRGCVLVCIFLASGLARAQAPGDLAAEVQRGMELWNVPGMSVAVVGRDTVYFQQGFGRTESDGGQVVDEHTLFAIASTTKAMVVAGVLMLVDDGALSLDDKVIKHIPELHFKSAALTPELNLRDLLAHRTGMPSTDVWTFLQSIPLSEQIELFQLVEQESPARTRLIYQNTMFELAGLIIERVSGKRWDEFLTDRLWQPIGMHETYGARGSIEAGKTHVMPHHYIDDTLTQPDWDFDADLADAAGSAWSSAHDMSLWAQFLLRGGLTADGKRLISEKSIGEMFEPHQLASPDDFYPTVELTKPNWRTYGLGWFQQDFQGRKIDFHTGSLSGLIAIIGLDRVNGEAVIVLGNRDHAEMRHAILWHVMDTDVGDDRRDWNQDIWNLYEDARLEDLAEREESEASRIEDTTPTFPLASYAGIYRNPVIGDLVVRMDGDALRLDTARVTFDIRHWHLNTFQAYKDDIDFRAFASFTIDPQATVSALQIFGQAFARVEEEEKKN